MAAEWLCVSENCVYALSSQQHCYARLAITTDCPQGAYWKKLPGIFSAISGTLFSVAASEPTNQTNHPFYGHCTAQPMLAGTSSAKFYCPHALVDGSQHIWIREMLELSSTVLSTLCPYHNTVRFASSELVIMQISADFVLFSMLSLLTFDLTHHLHEQSKFSVNFSHINFN